MKVDQEFLPLEEKDIRSMVEAEPGQEEETERFVTETICVEWGKSRARAQRYQEEIQLVQEEMDRTLRFFVWKAADWRSKGIAPRTKPISTEYAEGLKAYAERQAALCKSLSNSFKSQWTGVPGLVKSAKEEMEQPELFYQRKQRDYERRNKKANKIFTSGSNSVSSLSTVPET
ncbi:hypothetical protein EST38_g9723 [Candolleomyces aberdarensis]|uniref:Uncharacterized protein n=1 Tax=Candolleomyces aberdarensis TaxID=2316362 RepID=A0A4Q2DBE5_9AGAR|nr:hypothetical protein EST38_g9723 [Candolleomyces aberdarensis]